MQLVLTTPGEMARTGTVKPLQEDNLTDEQVHEVCAQLHKVLVRLVDETPVTFQLEGLSGRAYNVAKRMRVETVGDLYRLLLDVHVGKVVGAGPHVINEWRELLKGLGH